MGRYTFPQTEPQSTAFPTFISILSQPRNLIDQSNQIPGTSAWSCKSVQTWCSQPETPWSPLEDFALQFYRGACPSTMVKQQQQKSLRRREGKKPIRQAHKGFISSGPDCLRKFGQLVSATQCRKLGMVMECCCFLHTIESQQRFWAISIILSLSF